MCSLNRAQLRVFDPRSAGIEARDLHVVVGEGHERVTAPHVVNHVCGETLPPGSLVTLAPKVYMPTPELLFLQLASELSLMELLIVGMELCGRYALMPNGNLVARPALTSTKKIELYFGKCSRLKGLTKAKRAVGLLADSSFSPEESKLYLMLCLPRRYGGFGLPKAELNASVDMRGIVSGNEYRRSCDLLWRAKKLAIEYDSDQFHTGADKISKDAQRRVELSGQGISVVTITRLQLKSFSAIYEIATVLASHLKVRLRFGDAGLERQRATHSLLWPASRQAPVDVI